MYQKHMYLNIVICGSPEAAHWQASDSLIQKNPSDIRPPRWQNLRMAHTNAPKGIAKRPRDRSEKRPNFSVERGSVEVIDWT